MNSLKFTTLLAGFAASAISAHAIAVNFTSGPTDTANGFINIPFGASPQTYTNIGNLGYDIRFNFTNNNVITADVAPTTNGPDLTSVLAMLGNNSVLEVEFFETGTTNPIAVRGVQFRLDDVEKSATTDESITNFSYVDSKGNLKNPLFDDTSIFTPDGDPDINLNQPGADPSVFFHDGLDSQFQIGRGILVDLSDRAIQSFRFERAATGGGGTAVTLGLGEPVPIPFDGSSILGISLVAGYLGWRVRRKAKADTA